MNPHEIMPLKINGDFGGEGDFISFGTTLSVLLPDHDDGHPCALHASSLHLREEFALARCKCQCTSGDAHAGGYGESGGLDVFASYTLGWYLILLLSVKFS